MSVKILIVEIVAMNALLPFDRISQRWWGSGYRPGGTSIDHASLTALFEVLEPGVDHLFNAIELRAPEFAHFVETAIDIVEARIHVYAQFAEGLTESSVGVVQS